MPTGWDVSTQRGAQNGHKMYTTQKSSQKTECERWQLSHGCCSSGIVLWTNDTHIRRWWWRRGADAGLWEGRRHGQCKL